MNTVHFDRPRATEAPYPAEGQFLVYQAEAGKLKIDVRFECETVWLTQGQMAELFQITQQNISLHRQNLYRLPVGLEAGRIQV